MARGRKKGSKKKPGLEIPMIKQEEDIDKEKQTLVVNQR